MKKTELTPHERERVYRYTFTQIEQDIQQFLCIPLEVFHIQNYSNLCDYHIGLYPEILSRKPKICQDSGEYVWFEIYIGEGKLQRLDLLSEAITEVGLIINGF